MAIKKCPICKKNSVQKYLPFCSDRCQKLDLANWFGDRYVISSDDSYNDSLNSDDILNYDVKDD